MLATFLKILVMAALFPSTEELTVEAEGKTVRIESDGEIKGWRRESSIQNRI